MTRTPKAVALISGGLDSLLATRLILDQGIQVEGINFYTGFCVEGHTQAIRKQAEGKIKRNNALWVAEQLGIKLHFIDVVEAYKDVVLNPNHGYGQNLNPCLDCKIFMVGQAHQWMLDNDFDFVITGEVIGQRPKSQLKRNMPIIARESGVQDRLLRPLSAQLLEPSLPEREGWVDRSKLLDLSGRSRKPQIELAAQYGIEDFAQPAGGCCFLTDPNFTDRLKDLWANRVDRRYELDDIILLKVGRHFRMRPNFKAIIGREEGENRFMEGYRQLFTFLRPVSHIGPFTLLDGQVSDPDIELAARLAARYSDGKNADWVEFETGGLGRVDARVRVRPFVTDEIPTEWQL